MSTCDSWMVNHPGAKMSIYDIPPIVRTVLPLAITPSNIAAGFQATGIFPFNRDIFPESEYMAGYVTDRPDPTAQDANSEHVRCSSRPTSEQASPSDSEEVSGYDVSPEDVRPLPKAGPRKVSMKGRRKRKSAILTDTPIKRALEEEKCSKMSAKQLFPSTKKAKSQRPTQHRDPQPSTSQTKPVAKKQPLV